MKTPTIMLVLGTCIALGSSVWAEAPQGVNRIADTYQQGLDALQEGNTTLARQCFEVVLQQQPRHANARYHLLSLRNRGPELAAKARKAKLTKILIPKVDFDESTVPEALDALAAMIEGQTKGAFVPNFIVQDPGGTFAKQPLSMKLNQVPASVVLDYILNLGSAAARYDEHAIVVKPVGGGGGAKAAPPAADPFAK